MRPALALVALMAAGCQPALDAAGQPATLDEPYFRCRVQPVLTKYCSTFACHGDGARFFTVFARNRLRLAGDESERNAFLRPEERAFNYRAAIGMVDVEDPGESLLLRKPLEEAAGGWYHVGADEPFGGGDVFASADDPEYRALVEWVEGATEDPACVEPGSDR